MLPSSVLGLTAEAVEGLLAAAGRAPSLHNTQPWRFRISSTAIEMHANPDRHLPIADPDGTELRIACGAALLNLRLALAGRGIRPLVTVLPDLDRPDLIAIVRHGGAKPVNPDQQRPLHAIPRRRTNRQPFSEVAVTATELHVLRRAAIAEGAWLHIVEDPAQRTTLRGMAVRAHRQQVADPAFMAELRRWTATSPQRHDGVPVSAGGPQPAPQDQWVLRDYADGTGPARVEGKDFETEPTIAVLTSHLTGPAAEVGVGQAMQRVLLSGTAEGLCASFLSQLVEVPAIREVLRRLIGGTRPPHVVLRIGRGWPVNATPRRAVRDLIMTDLPMTEQPSPPG